MPASATTAKRPPEGAPARTEHVACTFHEIIYSDIVEMSYSSLPYHAIRPLYHPKIPSLHCLLYRSCVLSFEAVVLASSFAAFSCCCNFSSLFINSAPSNSSSKVRIKIWFILPFTFESHNRSLLSVSAIHPWLSDRRTHDAPRQLSPGRSDRSVVIVRCPARLHHRRREPRGV